MRRLDISLLGTFSVELNGEQVTDFGYDKVRALLAYLVVEGRRPQRRDTLADLLWSEQPQSEASTNLRAALYRLRSALRDRDADPALLLVTRESLRLNPDAEIDVDATHFVHLASESRHHRHPLGQECPACVRAMAEAVALYHGDFFPGIALESASFEAWVMLQRETLHQQALDLLDRLAAHAEAQGAYEQVLTHARHQIRLEPWRERAHRQAIRALAFSGQRAAAVAQFEACREVLSRELGVEPEPVTVALYEQLLGDDPLLSPTAHDLVIEREWRRVGPCPYRGLAAFREQDARFFFGRDAFVARLHHVLSTPPHVAVVVGPSGSGKSSVVFAGLLPRLREQRDWTIVSLRPGREPFQALATAVGPLIAAGADEDGHPAETRSLARALESGEVALINLVARSREREGGRAPSLIVVDQFEELYTLCADPGTRVRFIDTLWDAVTSSETISRDRAPLALLISLRADFLGQALAHRSFADALQTTAQMLGPMTREELREAIEKPATTQGAVFEAGLVDRIVDDVGGEGGSLPLLEFALTLLWRRLDRGWLTHAAYEATGGVQGALTRYAQQVYEGLSEADRGLCRRVFTQLVQPGEGTGDTRRVATRAEVGDRAWTLVRQLADQRLVVTAGDPSTGAETVEVTHEALIQHWAELQDWMAEDRVFRMWQERLRVSVRTWESTGHDEGALLRGAPLAEAEEWLRTRGDDLSADERAFVAAGVALREAQRQAELKAAWQLAEAHETALRQTAIGLAAEARNLMLGPKQNVAVLLALEAVEAYPYTWQAEQTLARVVLDWRLLIDFQHGVDLYAPPLASPDGARLVTADMQGTVRIWDLNNREPVVTVQAYQHRIPFDHHALWSPHGDRVLTGLWGGPPRVWDAITGQLLLELVGDGFHAEWSPDGSQILTSGSSRKDGATLWNARTGESIRLLPGTRGFLRSACFSPDGRRIASSVGQIWDAQTGELLHTLGGYQDLISSDDQPRFAWSPDSKLLGTSMAGTACVWDARTGAEIQTLQTGYRGGADLRWSPDGSRLLLTGHPGDSSPATIWNAKTGELLQRLLHVDSHHFLEQPWSPTGDRVLLADTQGSIAVWQVQSGREMLRLAAHDGNAFACWLRDGSGIASTALDGKLRVWGISPATLYVDGQRECPAYMLNGFSIPIWSPDGTQVGRNFADGTVSVWKSTTGERVLRLRKRGSDGSLRGVNCLAWSPDGGRIITGTLNGEVDIWNSASGEHLLALPDQHGIGYGLYWSPDSRLVLTCVRGRPAVIWDATTGEVLTEIAGQDFFQGAWSPDGGRVVLVDQLSHRGPVRVWDAVTGEAVLNLLPGDFAYGTAGVAWSPDGSRIVTFSMDSVGRLWDAATGTQLAAFHVPGNCMVAEWSPTGARFQVGSLSGVHVWDAATLDEVITYPAGDKLWGSWSPDGRAMALAYANQDLKVYPAWESLEALIAYAKEHCVLRELTPEERTRYGLPVSTAHLQVRAGIGVRPDEEAPVAL